MKRLGLLKGETVQTQLTTRSGRELTVTLRCWRQILMRGTSSHSIYRHPFTLLQIRVTDVEGQQVWLPMWLIAIGSRRHQLTCLDIYQSRESTFRLGAFVAFW
jgi:hypothetical protein